MREPGASDSHVATAKRRIDRLNQLRNNWIEQLDHSVMQQLAAVPVSPIAPLNTETIGSVIDRLSILALRIYHLKEQGSADKLDIAREQLAELKTSGQQLGEDMFAGRKRHKTYRALKMYNDPALSLVDSH